MEARKGPMMNCREIQRNMSAYLDGELATTERDAFFEHLHACTACCDVMGETSYFEAALAGLLKQRMEAPIAIRYNVMNAIAAEKARKAAPSWIPVWFPARPALVLRPAAAFATVLALVGVGWRTFSDTFQPDQPLSVKTQDTGKSRDSGTTPRRVASVEPGKARVAKAAPVQPIRKVAVRTTAPRVVNNVSNNSASSRPAPVRTSRHGNSAAQTPAERTKSTTAPPPAPTMVAANPIDNTVGTVSYMWAPDNVMNGRFLSRRDARKDWEEASFDLDIRTHLQTTESTVIEMTLKDGTRLKINENTEFIVQRAPTKEDSSWGIRLVRGELWVRSTPDVRVEIVAPGVSVTGADAEFSVRSFDGEDAATMVVDGRVECHNNLGHVDVTAGSASVSVAGEAPREPFLAADMNGHLEWAYRTKNAYNALDNGVHQM